jgi:hypothetical protein
LQPPWRSLSRRQTSGHRMQAFARAAATAQTDVATFIGAIAQAAADAGVTIPICVAAAPQLVQVLNPSKVLWPRQVPSCKVVQTFAATFPAPLPVMLINHNQWLLPVHRLAGKRECNCHCHRSGCQPGPHAGKTCILTSVVCRPSMKTDCCFLSVVIKPNTPSSRTAALERLQAHIPKHVRMQTCTSAACRPRLRRRPRPQQLPLVAETPR